MWKHNSSSAVRTHSYNLSRTLFKFVTGLTEFILLEWYEFGHYCNGTNSVNSATNLNTVFDQRLRKGLSLPALCKHTYNLSQTVFKFVAGLTELRAPSELEQALSQTKCVCPTGKHRMCTRTLYRIIRLTLPWLIQHLCHTQ